MQFHVYNLQNEFRILLHSTNPPLFRDRWSRVVCRPFWSGNIPQWKWPRRSKLSSSWCREVHGLGRFQSVWVKWHSQSRRGFRESRNHTMGKLGGGGKREGKCVSEREKKERESERKERERERERERDWWRSCHESNLNNRKLCTVWKLSEKTLT